MAIGGIEYMGISFAPIFGGAFIRIPAAIRRHENARISMHMIATIGDIGPCDSAPAHQQPLAACSNPPSCCPPRPFRAKAATRSAKMPSLHISG
ncbi:hypothetical protein C7S13_4437 [Burkholderia cepacia]|nr:hypothetical protein [Burkholderia cepacia]